MYTLIEIVLSVGVLVTLVTTLTACVCGCKNSNQKSELVGTAGVVKIRFEEEAPSPTPTTPASVKRASTQNSQRSLPEIPHAVGRHDSGDTASDIYATVNLDEGTKAVATTSSAREHPYEHAYAKLQSQSLGQNDTHNVTVEIIPDEASENTIQIDERETAQSGPESVLISASVAISGQLPSSQELPYITPPSPRPRDQAAHFSGDSTDSAKGYTSISVREPLSNIRAVVAAAPATHYATVSDDSDEMYAAIEEASLGEGSDTYAQIAPHARAARTRQGERDPHSHHDRRSAPPEVGATTSNATHSRQASSSSCSNSTGALGSPKPEKRSANSPLPPPPTHPPHAAHAAHTAHAAHASHTTHAAHASHTTHASHTAHATHATHGSHAAHTSHPPHAASHRVSNADPRHQRISSTGDLFGVDKLRRSLNEKHQRNNSCVSSSDFYGCNYPVEKHRFSSGDPLIRPVTAPAPPDSPPRNLDDMYAKIIKRKGKADEVRQKTKDSNDNEDTTKRKEDPGYETIDRTKSSHGYRKERHISGQDPGYETVREVNKVGNATYANGDIAKGDHAASDSEPNYEVVRGAPPTPPYATIAPHFKTPAAVYSTVNKHPPVPEPNYESMPQELYNTGSESDPNYESVRPKDPNYESVGANDPNYESLRCKDPEYESLRSKDPKYASVRSKNDPNYASVRSKNDPNYESVKYFDMAKDPPYERVRNDSATASIGRSDSAAGYEKINVPNHREPKSSISNGADDNVSDYFQV